MFSRAITSPVSPKRALIGLFLIQCMKLGVILGQPNSDAFKYWFYQCFQYPPYSFQCLTVHGDIFPMAYSLFWYSFYVPLTAGGYWLFNSVVFFLDCLIGILVLKSYSQFFLALWAQGSTYFLIVSPQDFLIWILMLAGRTRRFGPVFLALAVLTKLPLLPPITDPAIWNYILTNPYALHDPLNWARYSLIGFYWLFFLALTLYNRGLLHFPVNSRLIQWWMRR